MGGKAADHLASEKKAELRKSLAELRKSLDNSSTDERKQKTKEIIEKAVGVGKAAVAVVLNSHGSKTVNSMDDYIMWELLARNSFQNDAILANMMSFDIANMSMMGLL